MSNKTFCDWCGQVLDTDREVYFELVQRGFLSRSWYSKQHIHKSCLPKPTVQMWVKDGDE